MRNILPDIESKGAYDIVVLVFSSEVSSMPYEDLKSIIINQLNGSGVFKIQG